MQPSITPEMSTMIVVLGLSSLISVIGGIAGIISAFRRSPPIDQELINYVRHPDLLTVKAELNSQIADLASRTDKTFSEAFTRMAALQTATEKTFSDVNRTLGRIEGKLENCPNACTR
jgi:hypothetical protein